MGPSASKLQLRFKMFDGIWRKPSNFHDKEIAGFQTPCKERASNGFGSVLANWYSPCERLNRIGPKVSMAGRAMGAINDQNAV